MRYLFVVFASLILAPFAFAGNPHEVGDVTVTQDGSSLTASGKVSGLGNEAQIHIVLTADAQCVNPGGNKPKAANKQSVAAEGDFPVQNGHADFTLTATAVFSPSCSPPMSVVFSNILVVDTTNGLVLYP